MGETSIREKLQESNKRKKTTTRTFRIKDKWDLILLEEAERQNISVNLLIDKILRRYALFDRFTDRIDVINLSASTFKELIQFLPDDRLAKKGEKCGSLDAVEFFNSIGYPHKYETFVYLITEHFGSPKYTRWFQCFHHKLPNHDLFHLQHNLGRKWSVFVDNYLRAILKTIIKTKVESQIYDFAVTLKISHT